MDSAEDLFCSQYYEDCFKPYRIVFGLFAVFTPSPLSNTTHILGFYRKDACVDFSKKEIQLMTFLLPNLIEAFRLNLLNSFKPAQSNLLNTHESIHNSQLKACATMDNSGLVLEADDRFITLMEELGLLVGGELLLDFSLDELPVVREFNNLSISISKTAQGVCVEAIQSSIFTKLSKRKREICQLLIMGLTDKEIGRELGVSHNTVSNHLKDIYRMLGVASRPEAIANLSKHEV